MSACCCVTDAAEAPPRMPVSQLAVGQDAVIACIHSTRHAYAQRLSAFGVAPGRTVRLRQRHPTLVLQLGHTELALDHPVGGEILVQRADGAAATGRPAGRA